MERPHWIVEVLIVVISSGLAAIFWKDLKRFFRWILQKRSKDRFLRYFDDVVSIQEVLNQLIDDGAERVLLLRAHNGGSVPTVGKDLYCSTAFYSFDRNVYPHGVARYSRYILEAEYIELLRDLTKKLHITIDSAKLDSGHQLKAIHSVENIHHVELFKLGVVDDSMYYLSVSTTKDQPFSDDQKDRFAYRAGVLTSLIMKP